MNGKVVLVQVVKPVSHILYADNVVHHDHDGNFGKGKLPQRQKSRIKTRELIYEFSLSSKQKWLNTLVIL